MQATETYEWVFDAAQTNLELLGEGGADLVDSTHRMAVTYVKAITSGSTSVDVSVRIGFAATTLPTITVNSANGNKGVFVSHSGVRPGGGEVNANGGATLALGALGENPRLTCSVPSAGQLRIIIGYNVADA